MTIHRLKGMRAMLSGAMDAMDDHGAGWRKDIKQWLWTRDVEVFDPCAKATDLGEEIESTIMRKDLLRKKEWRTVKNIMTAIRNIDLRMIALADFTIVYLNRTDFTCGTWEELAAATVQRKPVIVVYEQGRINIPHWMIAQFQISMIFSNWKEAKRYLDHIDTAEVIDDSEGRWIFFDYSKLKGTVPNAKAEEEKR